VGEAFCTSERDEKFTQYFSENPEMRPLGRSAIDNITMDINKEEAGIAQSV
jgi:hypothetical protein